MVRFTLEKLTASEARYFYDPDGLGHLGILALNRITGERLLIEEAAGDYGHKYSDKVFEKLEEFNKSANFKETGIIAWC